MVPTIYVDYPVDTIVLSGFCTTDVKLSKNKKSSKTDFINSKWQCSYHVVLLLIYNPLSLNRNFFHIHGNPGDYAWGGRGVDAIITRVSIFHPIQILWLLVVQYLSLLQIHPSSLKSIIKP